MRNRKEVDASEQTARSLAAWLAPYIAEELGLTGPTRPLRPLPVSGTDDAGVIEVGYDEPTARRFVESLGDSVVANARVFFAELASHGRIGSLQLTEALDLATPRNIPSVLTTPLKRRAKTLGLSHNPWLEAADESDRTVWIGTETVPARLVRALDDEIANRRNR